MFFNMSKGRVHRKQIARRSYRVNDTTVLQQSVFHIRRVRIDAARLSELLRRDRRSALRWLRCAAATGLTPAQIVLGQMLLDGGDIQPDPQEAFAWFNKAATGGDPEAYNMLGRCYEYGWGTSTDTEKALAAYDLAARAGHDWGQVNLAQALMRRGYSTDLVRCRALFEVVANKGKGEAALKAMNSLGRFLEEGWGGPADPAQGLAWYEKAALLGDHWAQFNLGAVLLAAGNAGKASFWFEQAIRLGDEGFRERIAPLLAARPEVTLQALSRSVSTLRREPSSQGSGPSTTQTRTEQKIRKGRRLFASVIKTHRLFCIPPKSASHVKVLGA